MQQQHLTFVEPFLTPSPTAPFSTTSIHGRVCSSSAPASKSAFLSAPFSLAKPTSTPAFPPHSHFPPVFISMRSSSNIEPKRVLVIGGTRFSGLYLIERLARDGHHIVMFNRGSKKVGDKKLMVPGETEAAFMARNRNVEQIIGDRTDPADLRTKLSGREFDVIYDNNGRELEDSRPLIDMYKNKVDQYVYMSSAGVYLKSPIMPHLEKDEVDPKSRHKGKLDTETYMREQGTPFTSIRPTYIYGALNYNPLEEWFFERLDQGRPIPIPGHGMHLTGLGHVRDLANAMTQVMYHRDKALRQVYNIQDRQAITFDGVARACAAAMGKDPNSVQIVHYDPKAFDFGKKKGFPMRPQHFFTGVDKAIRDLDWQVEYDLVRGLKDSYENDFLIKKAQGKLKSDFSTDDMILGK